jgi:hypothetical protein
LARYERYRAITSYWLYRFKNYLPVAIQTARFTFDENEPMFLDADDVVALHSQISELQRAIVQQERVLAELQRLGEPIDGFGNTDGYMDLYQRTLRAPWEPPKPTDGS